MASIAPNGQAPDAKPYALDNAQPSANPRMKIEPRRSSAYIVIMKVSATTPKTVITVANLAAHRYVDRVTDIRAALAGVFDRASDAYDSVGVDFFSIFGRELVQDAKLEPGERVLDVGCGRGAVLFPAAEHVGAEGFVTGIDLAPKMVERTKRDAEERGVRNVDVQVMDAQEPELPKDWYDAILSSCVIFFLPDPAAALRTWCNALKPGGRLGVTTFGGEDQRWRWLDPLFEPFKPPMLKSTLNNPASPFSSTENVEKLLTQNGFAQPSSTLREHLVRFSGPDQWLAFSWSHGQRGFWELVPESNRPDVETTARAHLKDMAESDGSILLRQQIRYTIALRH
ncbi:MAG: hypothetical protein NVSMB57_13640 [Actinomycetota bacterium]